MPLGKLIRLSIFIGSLFLLYRAAVVWHGWNAAEALEPAGGRYFFRRLELPVPLFRQNDPRWGRDWLGPTEQTLGAHGSAVTSAAMVLATYGVDTDPRRLNRFLNSHGGYTPHGWIKWETAAALAPDRAEHVYEDLPTYYLIDSNLADGNPVIVRLRLPASGLTHYVVIAGKEGYDYLVRDPGAGASRGLYPLREIGSKIEALRFYRKLP